MPFRNGKSIETAFSPLPFRNHATLAAAIAGRSLDRPPGGGYKIDVPNEAPTPPQSPPRAAIFATLFVTGAVTLALELIASRVLPRWRLWSWG